MEVCRTIGNKTARALIRRALIVPLWINIVHDRRGRMLHTKRRGYVILDAGRAWLAAHDTQDTERREPQDGE